MTALHVAVLTALAVALAHDGSAARMRRTVGAASRSKSRGTQRPERQSPRRDVPLAVTAATTTALLVGGPSGILAGVAIGVAAVWALRRARQRDAAAYRADVLRALPLAADLLAACVAAGASPTEALEEVARAVPEPLAGALHSVVRGISLGLSAEEAWAPAVATGPPALRTMAAALVRSDVSGASPGPVVEALAAEQRERQRVAGEAAARRAGVAVVAPLGLCFLPAFVLIGVVPLVAGLLSAGLESVR
ncbi:MAG TPA: type II secretion system F family protein [Mycobacteriales bacterium]|nr:type II secretion system F family protein [Mycobacteriales bacterium]